MTSISKISLTRSAATCARGIIIDTMEINKNAIMICIAYWINAIRSPTCIFPASILDAPTYTIRTVKPFMISIIVGIINVIALFTNKFVFIRSILALSKRSSSCFSVLNARITESPVRISLVTKFNRSISFCKILNFGIATLNNTKITNMIAITPIAIVHVIFALVVNTLKIPPIPINGAYTTIRNSIVINI